MLLKHQHKQSGAVLLIMLVILIVGGTAILLNALNSATPRLAREKATADALAIAKEALIAYAINSENAGGANARPGNFPCPDRDAPGTASYGDAEPSCSLGGGTTIGRLPWKTLGIKELTDANNEPLWYVLSTNFRKVAPSTSIINSDTLGTLQVYDRDGTTLLTPAGNEAVAIVFAPGSVISSQIRNTNADKILASNYLDSANSRDNSLNSGPFIAADNAATFNDRLIFIKTRDFMPVIEKRVAKALQTTLTNYKANNGYYPYPATFSSCKDDTSCDSNSAVCRGRFPQTAQPVNWGVSGSPTLPSTGGSAWFTDNQWYRVIYYSAGSSSLATTPAGCSTMLTVAGNNIAALLFMPGSPIGAITRTTYPNNNPEWYLEDIENSNLDDIYINPSINSNDQLYVQP